MNRPYIGCLGMVIFHRGSGVAIRLGVFFFFKKTNILWFHGPRWGRNPSTNGTGMDLFFLRFFFGTSPQEGGMVWGPPFFGGV